MRRRAVHRGCAAPGDIPAGEMCRERLREQKHHTIEHRDIDVLAAAGLLASDERRQHADRAVEAAAGPLNA